MARQWNIRAPNSEEMVCGQCKTTFWADHHARKYCSETCSKLAAQAQMREYSRKQHQKQRREQVRLTRAGKKLEKFESVITSKAGETGWDFFDWDIAHQPVTWDEENCRVVDETELILDQIEHNPLVTARYA